MKPHSTMRWKLAAAGAFLFLASDICNAAPGDAPVAKAEVKAGGVWQVPGKPSEFGASPMAFSHDGKLLACASDDTQLYLFDAKTGKPVRLCQGDTRRWASAANIYFGNDDKSIFARINGTSDIFAWQTATGRKTGVIKAPGDDTTLVITTSPADGLLAIADNPGEGLELSLWDTGTGKAVRKKGLSGLGAYAVAFSPDGKMVAVSRDNQVFLLNTADLTLTKSLKCERTPQSLTFSPGGKMLAANYYHGAVVVWDTATGKPSEEFVRNLNHSLRDVAFSPNGKVLVVAGGVRDENRDLTGAFFSIIDPATGAVLANLADKVPGAVAHIAFSPDGTKLASRSYGETSVRLWDVSAWASDSDGVQPGPDKTAVKKPEPVTPARKYPRRFWYAAKGNYRIAAALVSVEGDHAKLRKDDGVVISVPVKSLSEKDQKYLSRIK